MFLATMRHAGRRGRQHLPGSPYEGSRRPHESLLSSRFSTASLSRSCRANSTPKPSLGLIKGAIHHEPFHLELVLRDFRHAKPETLVELARTVVLHDVKR